MASAAVLLPIGLLCIWLGGAAFLLLVAVACVILGAEWLGMCGVPPADFRQYWFPAGIVLIAVCGGVGRPEVALAILLLLVAAAQFSGRETGGGTKGGSPASVDHHHTGASAAVHHLRFRVGFGAVYLGLAAIALPWLRDDPVAGLANTLFALAVVWGSDIGAYMLGRLAGGPKLAPAISPGKTWSGAVGGLISATLSGLVVAACFSSEFSSIHVIGLALGLGIISQAGDLLESALKRHFGVKDSGRIIPGHGGLLDRLDALLAVAPAAALLAFTVGRGVVLWR